MTQTNYATSIPASGPDHRPRLFFACVISIVATSTAFVVCAGLLDFWTEKFLGGSTAKAGAIAGAGLYPFAISIVLFSLIIDRIGYGMTMVFAFLGHVIGTIVILMAKEGDPSAYSYLYIGTFITALANGAVEAATNPMVATMYAKEKTHHLNILHSGWAGGMVLAGVIAIVMTKLNLDWHWKIGITFLPVLAYALLMLGQKFPVQERVAAGVSYRDMMREFGAAGALLIMYFLAMAFMEFSKVFLSADTISSAGFQQASNIIPPVVAVVSALGFFAAFKSIGRPLFVFMLLIMILLATTELGVDSWVGALLSPVFHGNSAWLLIYTSAIMFVLRFYAGPLVKLLTPLGLLTCGAALAAIALFGLSIAGGTVWLVFVAATLYGCGKSFFWPTTLGIVSEQFPKGGALTLNAMGGMGMIAVGVLGGPFLGTVIERNTATRVQTEQPAIMESIVQRNDKLEPEKTTSYMLNYPTIDESKVKLLPAESKATLDKIGGETKQGSLGIFAILPAIMFICYLGLIIYFKSKGGYKAQEMETEKALGGIEGPVEA